MASEDRVIADIVACRARGDDVPRALVDELGGYIQAYRPQLLAIARSRVRNEERAQDIVQDTLATAWERLSNFRFQGSFLNYLVGIVRFRCMRRPLSELLSEDGELHAVTPEASQLAGLRDQEQLDVFNKALAKLEAGDQDVLYHRYQLGLSYEEITERLQLRGTGARGALQTARRRFEGELRAALRAHDLSTSFFRPSVSR
jgi:RNA polymerase sigma-70 factor (ECF subfamily)